MNIGWFVDFRAVGLSKHDQRSHPVAIIVKERAFHGIRERNRQQPDDLTRQSPAQAGKASKVTVERDPLTAPFNGKRSIPDVGHGGAARVCLKTETFENLPMLATRLDNLTMRLMKQIAAEFKSIID